MYLLQLCLFHQIPCIVRHSIENCLNKDEVFITYHGCFYSDKGSKRSTLIFFVQSVNLECHDHHCSNEEQGPKYGPYPVSGGHNSSQAMRGRVVAEVLDEGPRRGICPSSLLLWAILANLIVHFHVWMRLLQLNSAAFWGEKAKSAFQFQLYSPPVFREPTCNWYSYLVITDAICLRKVSLLACSAGVFMGERWIINLVRVFEGDWGGGGQEKKVSRSSSPLGSLLTRSSPLALPRPRWQQWRII